MALKRFDGTIEYAVNDSTLALHVVSVAGDGTVTDLGAITQAVSGVTFDKDVDIGDVNLLSGTTKVVLPTTLDANSQFKVGLHASDAGVAAITAKQDTGNTALAAIQAALVGTGAPIPLTLADPAADTYSAAMDPNPITRACTRLRVFVGNSGCVISLDGGVTDSISIPADYADDVAVAIPSGADVRVKRLTAGTAITSLIVEVR